MLAALLLIASIGWVQNSAKQPEGVDKAKQEVMKRELDDLRAKRREMDKRIAELERQLGVKPDPKAEQAIKEAQEALKRALESKKREEPYMHFWKEMPEGQTFKFELPEGKGEMRYFYFGPEEQEKLKERLKDLPQYLKIPDEYLKLPELKEWPQWKDLPEGKMFQLPEGKGWYYYYFSPDSKQPYLFRTPDSKKFMIPFGNDKQWHERLEMLDKLLQDQPSKQDDKAWQDWLKRLQELIESWKKV